jgi:hypothetical protein
LVDNPSNAKQHGAQIDKPLSPSPLFLPLSHIFKVKLNFKYKDLFKYWSTVHKSSALFPGQGVVVMQDYKNDDFFHLELLVQCMKSIIWI